MKSLFKGTLVTCFLLLLFEVRAQDQQSYRVEDSLRYSLLKNPFIQIEASEAIDAMYNFEFKKSLSHYNYLQKQYPWHPLPYLLKSLNFWWQIVPDYEETAYDTDFLAYIDTTKFLAKRLQTHNEIEGAFFLAAAYAFEGRLYSERRQYRKAAFASKDALKYLGECRGHETYSPELLFGDALFNYYAEWIREEYPLLRPIMMLFPDGDKEKGIDQLKETARNAFYSRTEAQYYLMKILSSDRSERDEAIQVGEYLFTQYPLNPYFHRYYTRLLYQSGRYKQAERHSLEILQRTDSGQTGYGANSARYAGFFLGHIYEINRDYEKAEKYYVIGMKYAEQTNAESMGYYIYSLLHLARIAERNEDLELAKSYYKQIKDHASRSHPAHVSARSKLKRL